LILRTGARSGPFLAGVVFVLSATGCGEADASDAGRICHFTERDLIGGWRSPVEDSEVVENDARELDFEIADGVRMVREYLHHRPMSSGGWTLEACRVLVTYQGGGTEEFRVEGGANPVLIGNPDDPEFRTLYRRIAKEAEPQ
jgi:hypothetical protein